MKSMAHLCLLASALLFVPACEENDGAEPLDLYRITGISPPLNCKISTVFKMSPTSMSSDIESIYFIEACPIYFNKLLANSVWPEASWIKLESMNEQDRNFLNNYLFSNLEDSLAGGSSEPFSEGNVLLSGRTRRVGIDHGKLLFIDRTSSFLVLWFW